MARRTTKRPGSRLHPAVRAFIVRMLEAGASSDRVQKELEQLAQDERLRRARLPDDPSLPQIQPDDLNVSRDTIKAMKKAMRTQPSGSDRTGEWCWWEEADPAVARLVLAACAEYETVTGHPWYPLTPELVERFTRLVELASGLNLPACLTLAGWWLQWESLPDRIRRHRLDDLGLFLSHRPWSSSEAAERYRWVAARWGVRFELDDRGLPLVIVMGWRLDYERELAPREESAGG
jgi:hypothetical protein